MRTKTYYFFGLLILIHFWPLTGCSHLIQGCEQRDWFELGRRDGLRGIEEQKLESLPQSCRAGLSPRDLENYRNGWSYGITQFCSEQNGFLIGKENLAAQPQVCPEPLRSEFTRRYQSGLEVFKISQEIFATNKELGRLEQRVRNRNLGPAQKHELQARLLHLRRKRGLQSAQLEKLIPQERDTSSLSR